jgi:hypothetical protein
VQDVRVDVGAAVENGHHASGISRRSTSVRLNHPEYRSASHSKTELRRRYTFRLATAHAVSALASSD